VGLYEYSEHTASRDDSSLLDLVKRILGR
jgi:hypothetical protein